MDFLETVITLKKEHKETWRDQPELYWLARLMQEVGELGSSLVGDHHDPADWELVQISAICLNWLEMRSEKFPDDRKGVTMFIKHRRESIRPKKVNECPAGGDHLWIGMKGAPVGLWCKTCGISKIEFDKENK